MTNMVMSDPMKCKRKNLDEEQGGDVRSRETSSRKRRIKNFYEDTKTCWEMMGKQQKRLDVKNGYRHTLCLTKFQQSVKQGPTYDCCSCRKL